jgi:hypothetical protein
MRKKLVTRLAVLTITLAAFLSMSVTAAQAEPNPCGSSTRDRGTGGDYYDGSAADWNYRKIYGNWYNCGGSGADRVKLVVSSDYDGPCITVPYGSTGYSEVSRKYKVWPPHYDGWKRC